MHERDHITGAKYDKIGRNWIRFAINFGIIIIVTPTHTNRTRGTEVCHVV